LILAFYAYLGYRRGFLAMALDWLGLGVSFALAVWLFPAGGTWLAARYALNPALARVLAFIALLLAARLGWSVVVFLVWRRIPRVLRRSRLNQAAGILPGLLQGAVVAAVGLVALAALPLPIVPHAEIAASTLGSALLAWGTGAEASVQQWMGGAVRDLLTFRTQPVRGSERVDLPFKTSQATPDPEAETAMLHLLNVERRRRSLAPLRMEERLRRAARQHSKDMLARGYFSHVDPVGHDPFQRLRAAGIPYVAAGENLAFAPSLTVAHSGLMNSPGHRANILRPAFHRAGIGILRARPYGLMITEEFSN